MRSLTLYIAEPCAESWAVMTPASGGRHCAACQKTVVDFTQKTDAEILAHLAQAARGEACGRVRGGQLGRPLHPPTTTGRRRSWLSALLAASGLLPLTALAAAAQPAAQSPSAIWGAGGSAAAAAGPQVALGSPVPADTLANITGVVLDASSHEPLPGVKVVVEGTLLGTTTAMDGRFTLALSPNEQPARLRFSTVGYVGHEQAVRCQAGPALRLAVQLDADVVGALVSYRPSAPWHPQALFYWGKYWLTRPFRR